MRIGSLLRLLGLLLAALVAVPSGAQAQAPPSERAVKAAFLPKFARYVTWPATARPPSNAPFQLCVIGSDPFGRLVDAAAAAEIADGHRFVVRRLATSRGADGCHIAFVQGTAEQGTAAALAALAGQPVLTVTDGRAGETRGMIHFSLHRGRVRFHIDEARAARSGLAISSRLLALALGVRQRG